MLAQHARRHNAHENLSDPVLGRPLCLLGLTLLKLLLLVLPVFCGTFEEQLPCPQALQLKTQNAFPLSHMFLVLISILK